MMHVLSSRILLRPTDPDRSRRFYEDVLGLQIYREFGTGPERGTVYFLGGGFLEISGRSDTAPAPGISLWLQVSDAKAAYGHVLSHGATVEQPPQREPWGLVEMWVRDPDGVRIAVVEVPDDHPLRYRP
ncbi:VOC family protein [Streptomyces sp. NPDC059828]|uniref:VOC family protein n=1 Tax=Streptomyces sp. NPDC059828 TaxID=3346965 RepID=UPI0036562AE5